MTYVYDMTMNDKRITSFKRYGATFRLEKKFVMGDRVFYSFTSPGMEKILVVPGFAEQYRELEAKLAAFNCKSDLNACRRWIKKNISSSFTEEEFPTELSESGNMLVIGFDYKDIRATFEYMNDTLSIGQEFEIRDNNLFGNGIVVSMNVDTGE